MENEQIKTADQIETQSEITSEAANLITDRSQIKQVLEAVIFAAPKSITLLRLKNILTHFSYEVADLKEILEELISESSSRGFQLVKVAGGYQFRTHPEHADVLQKLLEDKPARLSASALEVLAIVAYKQPVTRSDIDSVRGVDSGHLMKGLLEKNLIRTSGHAETPGRPLLYATAPYFLEVFGLGSLDDLPAMDEFNRELAGAGEGSENSDAASVLMPLPDADMATLIDGSGLAADPHRGDFDKNPEEEVDSPDFGLAERAKEELEKAL